MNIILIILFLIVFIILIVCLYTNKEKLSFKKSSYKNLFWAFWEGKVPSEDRLKQFKIWGNSIKKFYPNSRLLLLSNVVDPVLLNGTDIEIIKWKPEDLTDNKNIHQYLKSNALSLWRYSDLIRICLLYRYGGHWIDLDDILISKFPNTSNIMISDTRDIGIYSSPLGIIDGKYRYTGDKTIPFRFYMDIMLNFKPKNKFIKDMINLPKNINKDYNPQREVTQLFSSNPSLYKKYINPILYLEIFFHPHTTDLYNRKNTSKISKKDKINMNFFLPNWDEQIDYPTYKKIWNDYLKLRPTSIIKNHGWKNHLHKGEKKNLVGWIISSN